MDEALEPRAGARATSARERRPECAPAGPAGADDAVRRWLTLIVLCVGQLMIILDGTIVNVALPSIQSDLGFSQTSLAWVVNAYLISFGALLTLAGRLGDLIGRKKVSMFGLTVFTLASLLCGLAQTQEMLVAARFLQGVGGACASASVLAMLVTLFPGRKERARAMGLYSFVGVAGGSIGLLLGGVLTDAISWHWIFLVNLPIGVAALVAGAFLIQEARDADAHHGVDALGAMLLTVALMVAVYTIVGTEHHGLTSPRTVGFAGIVTVLIAAFLLLESRVRHPLVPLRVFRERNLVGGSGIQSLLIVAMTGWFFFISLYMVHVLGYSASATGAAFMPATIVIGVLSLGVCARLMDRFGARPVLIAGLVIVVAGLIWFARLPVAGSYAADVLPGMVLMGFGAGLAFMPLITIAMSDTTRRDSGLASGLVNTSQQLGGAIGLAVLATVSTGHTDTLLAGGDSRAAALLGGYRLAFTVAVAVAIVAIVATVVVLRHTQRGPEDPLHDPAHAEAIEHHGMLF